jgi:hypothetical protein
MGGGGAQEESASSEAINPEMARILDFIQTGIGGGVGGLAPKGTQPSFGVVGQETIDPSNPNGSPSGRMGQAQNVIGAAQGVAEGGSVLGALMQILGM